MNLNLYRSTQNFSLYFLKMFMLATLVCSRVFISWRRNTQVVNLHIGSEPQLGTEQPTGTKNEPICLAVSMKSLCAVDVQ